MAKGTRTRTSKVAARPRRSPARPRSISATDAEWQEVREFTARRGFSSLSDGARQLLRSGLRTEELVDEYAAASAWQLARAWADAQAIVDGDRAVGSWDRIAEAAEQARTRIRERAEAQRAVRTGA
jgi:hypothetical protein